MADSSSAATDSLATFYIQNMLNELKCPVCLDLLSQACSLTCGHAFCNDCIWKAAKVSYNCPVCKLPFSRREVRNASQLDNLVNSLKGINKVAGLHIDCSQPDPFTKSPRLADDDVKIPLSSPKGKLKRKAQLNSGKKSKQARRSDGQPEVDAKQKTPDRAIPSPHQPVKHSFPAKKRVQVSLYPPGQDEETPTKPAYEKHSDLDNDDTKKEIDAEKEPKMHTVSLSDLDEQGDFVSEKNLRYCSKSERNSPSKVEVRICNGGTLSLKPFFWLKEDDNEEGEDAPIISSQQTNPTQTEQSSPLQLSFSDLKDSDEEDSFQKHQSAAKSRVFCVPDTFDNELDNVYNIAEEVHHSLSDSFKGNAVDSPNDNKSLQQTSLTRSAQRSSSKRSISRRKTKRKTKFLVRQKSRKLTSHVQPETQSTYHKEPKEKNASDPPKITDSSAFDIIDAMFSDSPKSAAKDDVAQVSQGQESRYTNGPVGPSQCFSKERRNCIKLKSCDKTQVEQCDLDSTKNNNGPFVCAFCGQQGDGQVAGNLVHYKDGKPVDGSEIALPDVIHVHSVCAEWAPNVYFKDGRIMNLNGEIARSAKLKCGICSKKGAALGCFVEKCGKSFHAPCAVCENEYRFDLINFVMLCPAHSKHKLPSEKASSPPVRKTPRPSKIPCPVKIRKEDKERYASSQWRGCSKWMLCGSALNFVEKKKLHDLGRLTGATIVDTWNPLVTHVVASTDRKGASKRTLKFLMGIVTGRWVVSPDWIDACIKKKGPVKEEAYEICQDVHGISNGPKRGRTQHENKGARLFEDLSFYLCGEYAASLKKCLQDLITVGGGAILSRKPTPSHSQGRSVIVVFSVDCLELGNQQSAERQERLRQSCREAKALADATGAKYAPHTWLLDCVAAFNINDPTLHPDIWHTFSS